MWHAEAAADAEYGKCTCTSPPPPPQSLRHGWHLDQHLPGSLDVSRALDRHSAWGGVHGLCPGTAKNSCLYQHLSQRTAKSSMTWEAWWVSGWGGGVRSLPPLSASSIHSASASSSVKWELLSSLPVLIAG